MCSSQGSGSFSLVVYVSDCCLDNQGSIPARTMKFPTVLLIPVIHVLMGNMKPSVVSFKSLVTQTFRHLALYAWMV